MTAPSGEITQAAHFTRFQPIAQANNCYFYGSPRNDWPAMAEIRRTPVPGRAKNINTYIFQLVTTRLIEPQAPAEDNEAIDRLARRAI